LNGPVPAVSIDAPSLPDVLKPHDVALYRIDPHTVLRWAMSLPDVLKPHDVAALYRVDTRTVVRWAKTGRLAGAFKTLGGNWRFNREEVIHQWKTSNGETV
jgi:excisionase family DNA binding protein